MSFWQTCTFEKNVIRGNLARFVDREYKKDIYIYILNIYIYIIIEVKQEISTGNKQIKKIK